MLKAWRQIGMILLAVALAVAFGTTANAQAPTGRIVGNVTDPSGAAIPDAKVTVTNAGTAIAQQTTTGSDGFYQVLALPIGNYTVTVQKEGFQQRIFENQPLQINQSLRLDAQMVIGSQSQSVTVKAQATTVETENPTVGSTVVGSAIQDAPLNGRNALDLAKLQPGVTENNANNPSAGSYSIAGGRSDSVAFLLDGGVNNNLLDDSVVYNPNPDSIAEFRILQSDYSAEYGRNAGGVISVVTKSGTNEWHGTIYDYIRNDAFDANSFFNKQQSFLLSQATGTDVDIPRDVLKRHQYGATLGAPIKKNKLFFFESYQGQRQTIRETPSNSSISPVPTPLQLGGDFEGTNLVPQDKAVTCFLTGFFPNGTGCAQDAMGNPIPGTPNPFFKAPVQPASCIFACALDPTKFNPAAVKYITAGIIPTSPTGSLPGVGPGIHNDNESSTKIDYLITEKDKLTGTVGFIRANQVDTFAVATAGGIGGTSGGPSVGGFPRGEKINNYFLNVSYDRTISSNLLNQLQGFAQRNFIETGLPVKAVPTPTDLGIMITPDNPATPFSGLDFGNGLNIGVGGQSLIVSNTFGVSDNLSWVHGRNTWKFGGGISAFQNDETFDSSGGGFGFDTSFTGNPYANFLLGVPASFSQGPRGVNNGRTKSTFAFLQDEWRVTKRLTLNAGLRYEYNSPIRDTLGRTFSIIPGLQSTRFTNAPIGLVFPGDKGAPVGANFPDKDNFAPRVGFAWDPWGNAKTSVRGGFGVFYDVVNGGQILIFNGTPPFYGMAFVPFPSPPSPATTTQTFLSDPYGSTGTVNPFPSQPPARNVDFAASGFLPFGNNPFSQSNAPHIHTPYVYQYNLSVQRNLATGLVLELDYVGSSSHGLPALIDVNPFAINDPTYNYNNPLGPQRVLNLQPGAGTCPDQPLGGTGAGCSFGTLPTQSNAAKAHYNGFEAGLTKQTGDLGKFGSAAFTLGYTYGINRDDCSISSNCYLPATNRSVFMSYSDFDVRQRVTFSGGWTLPFDRLWTGGPKKLTQGWNLFPIFTWHTGFPISVVAFPNVFGLSLYSEGPSGIGDPGLVNANVVGPTNSLNPHQIQTINGSTGSYWLNPNSFSANQSAFDNPADPNLCAEFAGEPAGTLPSDAEAVACPGIRTYGSLRRNSLRGPGAINLDLSISKITPITERLKLEIRGDFFNIFNHAQFLNPDSVITDATFGQITTTAPPRIIQVAARFTF